MEKIDFNKSRWFVAGIVTCIKNDGIQDDFPVFEDYYLINSEDIDSAAVEAERIGREISEIDDAVTFKGIPAKRVFVGVRKIRSVYNNEVGDIDFNRPSHRTELTHSYYEVSSWDDVLSVGSGKRVRVDYVDDSE